MKTLSYIRKDFEKNQQYNLVLQGDKLTLLKTLPSHCTLVKKILAKYMKKEIFF